ncbi:unnamed protein product [Dicrocoelium dendriticum]|nr:unnamed protein product [Dicrocoelium dendriticum]
MFHNEKLQHRTVRRKRQHGWSSRRRMRSFPQSAYHFQMGERKANSRRMRSSGDLDGKLQTSHRSAFSEPEISIHRLLIRPAIVELDEGTIRARLRYVIQLHKKMTGYYRLILEARITPDFPPIYVGKVQNVCAHWPANTAHSGCDARIPRFYQNGHVCFCHMSPGVYQQRLRLNMPNVLDGLEVPRFLVNILFSEKVFDIYLTLRLEKSKGELAGCVQVKIPLSLSST